MSLSRRRLLMSGLAGPLTCALLAGCEGPAYRYRYKLTLEIQDGERVLRSSNVVQRVEQAPTELFRWPTEVVQSSTMGEANIADLGQSRLLIALLSRVESPVFDHNGPIGWFQDDPLFALADVYSVHLGAFESNGRSSSLEELLRKRGPRELRSKDLPTLVTFTDPLDPNTIQKVDPANLEALFGSGVHLRRSTIEITDDPVTSGIEARLPWIARLGKGSALVPVDAEARVHPISVRKTSAFGGRVYTTDFERGVGD